MATVNPFSYILIASPVRVNNTTIPAFEIIKGRVQNRYWPLGEKTRNRSHFKLNDSVVFYAARLKAFVGIAEVASASLSMSFSERAKVEYKYDYLLGAPYGIRLSKPTLFETPVPIERLIDSLEFVKNKNRWWTYLQGGTTRITRHDFNLIIAHSLDL